MNQGYRFQNGRAELPGQKILKSLRTRLPQTAEGKIYPAQACLSKNQLANELLGELSVSDAENLLASMHSIYLDKRDFIYQPDDEIEYLYFPESAVISEFQILENGKTIEISMIGREGVAGISSLFGSQPSLNFSEVLIPGTALRISSKCLKQQLKTCCCLQEKIFRFANRYVSQISRRIVCNQHHTMEERICLWLLMIYGRCGRKSLPLTQEQIARFLGVHRPSVTLITQILRDKGIIDYVRGTISITDKQKLINSACSCYSLVE